MSTPGRGRGYPGRHHAREPRPGDAPEAEPARGLPQLSPKPIATVSDPEDERSMDDEAAMNELLAMDEQYAPLLALLEQFSPGEDGIQFNRKLRNFEATVTKMCPDENSLQQAFATFRAAALRNSSTARKLASVGASFTRQQRQQLLRGALLNVVMQGTFSKLDILERANPQFLINAANLMGDYFAEARLCNGNKVHILASPLLQYLRALLASDHIRAHRSLATQLMQNGRELLSQHTAQELDDLSISIRLRLLSPPSMSMIWLLLSADLCLNKFLPLPNTLQQFYASHLELTSDEGYSEVSYGSWRRGDDGGAERVNQSLAQVSLDEADAKPKLRPILGAGAGLLRQEQAQSVTQDSFETWTPKNSLSKRYDLNSWRQNDEECSSIPGAAFPLVPDYPPPDSFQPHGDGAHIQPVQVDHGTHDAQGDFIQFTERPPPTLERVNNEIQKSGRRPADSWRREGGDVREDANRNKPRWNRPRSRGDDDDETEKVIEQISLSR
ncbi:uncharacterized protein LOC106138573 isoform X2 [Amyelois transitella]|uniref:uncharacterized protein LOC106138573 isoform X2 n=1 Tax=Amyelois transitella TaxID=680683 RepID=UPI0029905A16|nr:uncharacterized protein LOC106138573 isoform X2 [Amyelois transitella]